MGMDTLSRIKIARFIMSEIILPYPVSTNRYWRIFRGKAVPSKEATAYKMLVKARAREAGIKPIIGHVSLRITLRPKLNKDGSESKVCIDLDNALKVTLDALNGVAYADDSQIVELYVVKGSAVDGGGLVVSISDLRPLMCTG